MNTKNHSGLIEDQHARPAWVPVVLAVSLATALVIAFAVVRSTTSSDSTVEVTTTTEPSPSPSADETGTTDDPAGITVVANGKFQNEDYEVGGGATVVQTADGGVLRLGKDFESESGPALVVYLLPAGVEVTDVNDGSALGALQSFSGAQNYTLPRSFKTSDAAGAKVVIWCQKFSLPFGSAALTQVNKP